MDIKKPAENLLFAFSAALRDSLSGPQRLHDKHETEFQLSPHQSEHVAARTQWDSEKSQRLSTLDPRVRVGSDLHRMSRPQSGHCESLCLTLIS